MTTEALTPESNRGLYRKFNVTRSDGTDAPGGKHEGCDYFVLDLTHDPFAYAAIRAYARKCEEKYPALADDLHEKAAGMLGWMAERQFAEMTPDERKVWEDFAYNDPERR